MAITTKARLRLGAFEEREHREHLEQHARDDCHGTLRDARRDERRRAHREACAQDVGGGGATHHGERVGRRRQRHRRNHRAVAPLGDEDEARDLRQHRQRRLRRHRHFGDHRLRVRAFTAAAAGRGRQVSSLQQHLSTKKHEQRDGRVVRDGRGQVVHELAEEARDERHHGQSGECTDEH